MAIRIKGFIIFSWDISIMEEFWVQIFKISLIEGLYVKSRMI